MPPTLLFNVIILLILLQLFCFSAAKLTTILIQLMADRGLLKITEEEFSGPPINVSLFMD